MKEEAHEGMQLSDCLLFAGRVTRSINSDHGKRIYRVYKVTSCRGSVSCYHSINILEIPRHSRTTST